MIICSEYDKDLLVRNFINELSEKNKFAKLPGSKSRAVREFYINNLPPALKESYKYESKSLFEMEFPCNIFTANHIQFATGFSRIVVGDYGAYIEIPQDRMFINGLKGVAGQEFRYMDDNYRDKVKYNWLTCIADTSIKIYYQKKEVKYADYKPGFFYVSPYECILEYVV